MASRCELSSTIGGTARQPAVVARRALLLGALAWAATAAAAAASPASPQSLTRRRLIGAWRLVRIDYAGPEGARVDPFYQPGSVGLIVYDASGWMSCQIGAPHRSLPAGSPDAVRSAGVPDSRTGGPAAPRDAREKAAAYDSYYAYYGTWDFDAVSSVVTHHVKASLIPAETGLDYAQTATLEGGRLIFRSPNTTPGRETQRTKVWERIPAGGPGRESGDSAPGQRRAQ